MSLNIEQNRKARKYTQKEQFLRVLWGGGKYLFKLSPRISFSWRAFILRLFGAKIGRASRIYSSAVIYMPWNLTMGDYSAIGENALIYNLGKVSIGKNVSISHRSHLCAGTHDYTDPLIPLLKPPITLKDNVWICADAFLHPGVVIPEGAVVGARSVVTKSLSIDWAVYAGNPCKQVALRTKHGTINPDSD